MEFPKGSCIYSGTPEALYMVACGRVKVSMTAENGGEAIVKIVPPECLFGESFMTGSISHERAVALDRVQLMTWKRAEIEQQIEREPRLGLALLEALIEATLEMQERIHAMAVCKTPQRVMLSLLHLAESLGERQADGALRMNPLTHHLIAAHVGTSREIVSTQMSRLRRLGLVRYSRKHIDVYGDAVRDMLQRQGFPAQRGHSAAAA